MVHDRSLDLIEASDELARLHVERSGEAHHDRDGRVAAAGLDLGEVRDADPGALGADRLREAAAVPQFAHPQAERAAEPLVQIVGCASSSLLIGTVTMIVAASTPTRPTAEAESRMRRAGPSPRGAATASVTAVPRATGPIASNQFAIFAAGPSSRGSSSFQPGTSAASPNPREPASSPADVRLMKRRADSIVRFTRVSIRKRKGGDSRHRLSHAR